MNDSSRQRVLIIEDSFDSAELLRLVLSRQGRAVELAHSGAEGLAAFETFKPDVVICDIGLPGELNGHRIAQTLRATTGGEALFLIALSGYSQDEDVQQSLESGFDLHLNKPIDPDELSRLLETAATSDARRAAG